MPQTDPRSSDSFTPRRLIVGDVVGPFDTPTTYVALIPSDGPIDPRELARRVVADMLARNGMPTDATTIEQILTMEEKDGIGFIKESTGALSPPRHGEWPGASHDGKNPDGTYTGYEITLDHGDQQRVLEYRKRILGPPLGEMDDQTKEKILLVIEALKQVANANGNEALSGALDTLKTGIELNDQDRVAQGLKMAGGGPAALFKLFEQVYDKKLDANGAGILTVGERYSDIKGIDAMNGFETFARISKVFSVGGDTANIYLNTYKMYRGVDENGKPLTAAQYAEAGLDLAQSLRSVGAITLEAAGEKLASTGLLRVAAYLEAANVPLSIVTLQYYGMKYVVEGAMDIHQVAADHEFRRRMGFQELGAGEFSGRLDTQLRNVEGMQTGPGNAAQTIVRMNQIIADGGKTAEMWHRYVALAVEPREMAEKLAAAKNTRDVQALGLSEQDLSRFADGFKKAYPAFVDACARDAAKTTQFRNYHEPWSDVLKDVRYVSLSEEKIQQLRKADIDLKASGLSLIPASILDKLAVKPGPDGTPTPPGAKSPDGTPPQKDASPTSEKPGKSPSAMADGRLREGERGEEVRWLQRKLETLGYTDDKGRKIGHNGVFNDATEDAVIKFQKAKGLPATGIADGPTLRALIHAEPEPKRTDPGTTAGRALADGILREGERGPEVGALQTRLRELGYTDDAGKPTPSTGTFGKSTREAVAQFQRENGIPETGIADDYTLAKMRLAQPRPAMNDGVLRPGESGQEVKELQTALKELGLLGKNGRELEITGRYDQDTATAVKTYQTQQGLPPTGIADTPTLIKLGLIVQVESKDPPSAIAPTKTADPASGNPPAASRDASGPTLSLRDETHPDHALYRQAYIRLDASRAAFGLTSETTVENAAAALAASAKAAGIAEIDTVTRGVSAKGETMLFAVQGKDPAWEGSKMASANFAQAVATPLEVSSGIANATKASEAQGDAARKQSVAM